MDAVRAQLDELLGKDRNLAPHEKKKAHHFTDPEVCKHYICGFCPHDLFVNTKSDLGACPYSHDDGAKAEFEKERKNKRYSFEKEFLHYLEKLIWDLDKRIKKGYERLEQQDVPPVPLTPEVEAKVQAITARIQTLLKQMEDLAEEGKVEESSALMPVIDSLKAEKQALLMGDNKIAAQEKRMRVCDTCGAFLVVGDTDKRTVSHLEGKQHQGYLKIRQTIEELQKHFAGDTRPEAEGDRERYSSSRQSDPERYRNRGDKDRHTPQQRDDRHHNRDRRDNFRERDNNNRDRDRHDRHRDSDKRRERDYDRADREKRRRDA